MVRLYVFVVRVRGFVVCVCVRVFVVCVCVCGACVCLWCVCVFVVHVRVRVCVRAIISHTCIPLLGKPGSQSALKPSMPLGRLLLGRGPGARQGEQGQAPLWQGYRRINSSITCEGSPVHGTACSRPPLGTLGLTAHNCINEDTQREHLNHTHRRAHIWYINQFCAAQSTLSPLDYHTNEVPCMLVLGCTAPVGC